MNHVSPYVNGQRNNRFVNPSLLSNSIFGTQTVIQQINVSQSKPSNQNMIQENKQDLMQKYKNRSQLNSRNGSQINSRNGSQINSRINSRNGSQINSRINSRNGSPKHVHNGENPCTCSKNMPNIPKSKTYQQVIQKYEQQQQSSHGHHQQQESNVHHQQQESNVHHQQQESHVHHQQQESHSEQQQHWQQDSLEQQQRLQKWEQEIQEQQRLSASRGRNINRRQSDREVIVMEEKMCDDYCGDCVNQQLIENKRMIQEQEEREKKMYCDFVKENDKMMADQDRYNQRIQKEKAKYYQDVIEKQIYEKNMQKNYEKQLENGASYQAICQSTFDREDDFQLKRRMNQMCYNDDLLDQIEQKQYMKEFEKMNNKENQFTGLEIENRYMNKYLPTHQQYMDGVKQQIDEKRYFKMVDQNQQKQQDRYYVDQVKEFFNNEQQRIKEYEQRKKVDYQNYIRNEIDCKEQLKKHQKMAKKQEEQQMIIDQQENYYRDHQENERQRQMLKEMNKQSIKEQIVNKREEKRIQKENEIMLDRQIIMDKMRSEKKVVKKVMCKGCHKHKAQKGMNCIVNQQKIVRRSSRNRM